VVASNDTSPLLAFVYDDDEEDEKRTHFVITSSTPCHPVETLPISLIKMRFAVWQIQIHIYSCADSTPNAFNAHATTFALAWQSLPHAKTQYNKIFTRRRSRLNDATHTANHLARRHWAFSIMRVGWLGFLYIVSELA
jgi:hypothetical protein